MSNSISTTRNHIYIAIDLKSFYASVKCIERGLNPLATNLVVADPTRTEKTICLAVSPSLKAYGIPGRPNVIKLSPIVHIYVNIMIKLRGTEIKSNKLLHSKQ